MAIKRLTIELDDIVDLKGSTTVPAALTSKQEFSLERKQPTGIAAYEKTEETETLNLSEKLSPTTGRTFPDLIIEFKNSPRAMATILMFVPVILFVTKVKSFVDLTYPAAVGIGLNLVWFSVPLISRLVNRLKREIREHP